MERNEQSLAGLGMLEQGVPPTGSRLEEKRKRRREAKKRKRKASQELKMPKKRQCLLCRCLLSLDKKKIAEHYFLCSRRFMASEIPEETIPPLNSTTDGKRCSWPSCQKAIAPQKKIYIRLFVGSSLYSFCDVKHFHGTHNKALMVKHLHSLLAATKSTTNALCFLCKKDSDDQTKINCIVECFSGLSSKRLSELLKKS
eukprot:TRINITY_DN276_c0_g1_i13.p1 TRINITY_DN276_c0_g1~~TRINITY_DN276_c0_g1_i13.p1  ORF type:complete len:199 (-),score=20.15 TRINITY_DN276_c0_g1_i13:479-1075(-)